MAPLLDVNWLITPYNCLTYPETSDIICKQSDESDSEEENDGNNSVYTVFVIQFYSVFSFLQVPWNILSFTWHAYMLGINIITSSLVVILSFLGKVAVLPGAADYPSDSDADSNSLYSDSSDDEDESMEHTLGFKCVGAAHKKPRQEFLQVVAKKLSKEQLPMKVKLRAEPEDEKDNMGIAIDMDHGTGWFYVGYITSELTQSLHLLILNEKVVDMSNTFTTESFLQLLPFNHDYQERKVGKLCYCSMPKFHMMFCY